MVAACTRKRDVDADALPGADRPPHFVDSLRRGRASRQRREHGGGDRRSGKFQVG
jgi:hypothetical protein